MSDKRPAADRIDEEFASHVQRAFGFDEPPGTYGEFWEEMTTTFATALDRDVSLDDLCTTDESPHWASVDGERQYYQCVTDAFVVGATLDDPVTVRTVSPVSGTEIVVEFDRDGVVSAPEDAVLSFGVERSVERPDGPITPQKMYGRFCPYNEAFASPEEYEEWAADNPDVVSDDKSLGRSLDTLARVVPDAGLADDGELSQESGRGCGC
ncbi:hypothetical protein BRD00_14150 [Halobacteriales archaeon QS_8_69_26]|nr:MAG: hypothetical protein BRD00_14150 [Halobacteriales archaeon QS_8_69_26]